MKKAFLLICVVGALCAADLNAQNPSARSGDRGGMERREGTKPQQGRGDRPQRMTPEQQARMTTDRMTRELGLNEKQVRKVYNINLSYYTGLRNLIMGSVGAGMGGQRGQGMGPGNGFGGGNDDMGGFGGSRGGDRSVGPRGGGIMSRISQEDMAKLNAEREKKLSKTLSAEQMVLWKKLENERRQKEYSRMKQMREGHQGQPGSRGDAPRRPDGQRRQAE